MSAFTSPGTSHHLPIRSRRLTRAKINEWFSPYEEIKAKKPSPWCDQEHLNQLWTPLFSGFTFPGGQMRSEANPQRLKPPLSDFMRRQFSFRYQPSHSLILVRKHDPDLIESTAVESAAAGIKYILLSGQSHWLTVRIRAAQSRAAHPSGKLSGIPVLLWGTHQNSTWVLCFCAKYPLRGLVACGFDTNLPAT